MPKTSSRHGPGAALGLSVAGIRVIIFGCTSSHTRLDAEVGDYQSVLKEFACVIMK